MPVVTSRAKVARQLAALWNRLERAIGKAGIDTASSRTLDEIVAETTDALQVSGNSDAADRLNAIRKAISLAIYGGGTVTSEDVKRVTADLSYVIPAVNSLSKVARRR